MTPTEQFHADGAQQWLIRYPMNASSVIFDVGGYLGGFTMEILRCEMGLCAHCGSRRNPQVHVFEPIPEFAKSCVETFADYPRVKVWPFALGNQTERRSFGCHDSASGFFTEGKEINVEVRDIVDFVHEQGIREIELISINIEGGEYDLLNRMMDCDDLIRSCRNVQVQFHELSVLDCKTARTEIHKRLAATHELAWNYDFVWESWRRK